MKPIFFHFFLLEILFQLAVAQTDDQGFVLNKDASWGEIKKSMELGKKVAGEITQSLEEYRKANKSMYSDYVKNHGLIADIQESLKNNKVDCNFDEKVQLVISKIEEEIKKSASHFRAVFETLDQLKKHIIQLGMKYVRTQVRGLNRVYFKYLRDVIPGPHAKEEEKLCLLQEKISKHMEECLEKSNFDKSKLEVKCNYKL